MCIALWKKFFNLSYDPCCRTTAVSNYTNGTGASHYEGRCAVRGFTVNQLFAVDLFTKYSALGLDDVADHSWVDNTVLCGWISCFCIGLIGGAMSSTRLVSCFAPSQAHFSPRQASTCACCGLETSLLKPDTRGGGLPPISLGAPC